MRKKEKNLFVTWTVLAMMLIVMLSGCGTRKTEPLLEEKQEQKEYKNILSCKWILKDEEAKASDEWEVVQYIPNQNTFFDEEYTAREKKVLVCKDILYEVVQWEKLDTDHYCCQYELKTIDLNTGEKGILVPDIAKMDFQGKLENTMIDELKTCLEKKYAWVISLDGSKSNLHMFIPVWDTTWTIQHYYDIVLNTEGNVLEITDYVDNLWPIKDRTAGMFRVPEAVCGENGKVCFFDPEKDKLHMVDKAGDTDVCVTIEKEYKTLIQYIGKNSEGVPIFSYVPKDGEVEIFILNENGMQTVFRGNMKNGKMAVDTFGNVLLLQRSRLMVWNVEKGTLQEIYRFEGLESYSCLDIARNDEGHIFVHYDEGEDSFVYRLQDGKKLEMVELTLLQSMSDTYTAQCAADYTRTHPGVKIRVEVMDDSQDFAWTKLVENIKAGKGPDLILMNRKQLNILQRAEIVCSLDSYLSDTLRDNIFAGALRFGEFDSALYAIPYEASMGTLMIANKNWEKDCWTLEEMMDTYDSWKKNNREGERFESVYYPISSIQLLYDLCIQGIEYSNFINLKTLTCDFENESFYRLLRFCLENGDNSGKDGYWSLEDRIEEFESNRAFTYYMGNGFIAYSNRRNKLGDESTHAVGYPIGNGVKGFVHCYRGVALSNLSANKDVAADFLFSLVSEEYQVKYSTDWVRKDVLKKYVKNGEPGVEGWEEPYFEINIGMSIPLKGRPDGTSYVDEYISFMEEGLPLTNQYEIQNIIVEEVAAYFMGDKTEKEVAKIIQSRVQLYLEEQR